VKRERDDGGRRAAADDGRGAALADPPKSKNE
jgi:hypothetical protein